MGDWWEAHTLQIFDRFPPGTSPLQLNVRRPTRQPRAATLPLVKDEIPNHETRIGLNIRCRGQHLRDHAVLVCARMFCSRRSLSFNGSPGKYIWVINRLIFPVTSK